MTAPTADQRPTDESTTSAWTSLSGSLLRSAVAANRAALAAFGHPAAAVSPERPATRASDGGRQRQAGDGPRSAASAPSLAYEQPGASTDRSVESADVVEAGDWVTYTKRVDDDDVRAFARASGDANRLHLDDEFATSTRFGERVVHGTLVSGLISAALARLPGTTVYLSQDLSFARPVPVGDEVTARVEVVEALGDDQFRLSTEVYRGDGETAVEGEAVVLVDDLPADA